MKTGFLPFLLASALALAGGCSARTAPPPSTPPPAQGPVQVDRFDWAMRGLEHTRSLQAQPFCGRTLNERCIDLAAACEARGKAVGSDGWRLIPGSAIIDLSDPAAVEIIWPAMLGNLETQRTKTILPRWRTTATCPAWQPVNQAARELSSGEMARWIPTEGLGYVPDGVWDTK